MVVATCSLKLAAFTLQTLGFLFSFGVFLLVSKKLKAQGWTPIYLIIVIIIAVILLVTFVKPLFQQASGAAGENVESARQVLKFIPLAFS